MEKVNNTGTKSFVHKRVNENSNEAEQMAKAASASTTSSLANLTARLHSRYTYSQRNKSHRLYGDLFVR